MKEPGAGVRAVCGAVGACLAGRIVANVNDSLPARGLPALQCRLVCDAGGSGVGRDGREVRKVRSVQFSSVQFSSVQFSSVQFSSVHCSSGQVRSVQFRYCMHACMHALARGRLAAQNGARPHASAHCSPQPPPVAAASPTLKSPFARLSHVANHAQLLSQLLADQ